MPILDKCELEQKIDDFSWTPSKLISRLGAEINDERSICYWAHRNRIPIFCPALTDGSIGDMLYFHSYRRGGIKLDIVEVSKEVWCSDPYCCSCSSSSVCSSSGVCLWLEKQILLGFVWWWMNAGLPNVLEFKTACFSRSVQKKEQQLMKVVVLGLQREVSSN